MEDPIQRHPTRQEQLDMLVHLVAEQTTDGDHILDLGCGTGYVASLLLESAPNMLLTGVDLSADSLMQAADNLGRHAARFTAVEGDLNGLSELGLNERNFKVIYTCLTFHDLTHEAKQAVIQWSAAHLAPGGFLLVYDRIRLTEASLFPMQTSLWRRIERLHGRGMRTTPTFDTYQSDLGVTNNPASLSEYLEWINAAGLAGACIHLHGNIGLIAGAA